MQFDDHPAPPPPTPRGPSRRTAWLAAAAVALLVVVAIVTVVVNRSDDVTGSPAPEPPSPRATAAPTTTIDTQTEVVARLREILIVRDKALLSRNVSLLDGIYTVDCNCLKDGRTTIRRLRQDKVIWKGLLTELTVQQVERVNGRLWTVIGVLSTPAVRIESESGVLIRVIPPESNQLRFAMARPVDVDEWLLGHVSLLNKGG
jgi:hypothetical protein